MPNSPDCSTFILIKPTLVTSQETHFAGGKHAFQCMASTLTACGHDVHVVCATRKTTLLAAAITGAPMAPQLTELSAAPSGSAANTLQVASWRCPVSTHAPMLCAESASSDAADTGPCSRSNSHTSAAGASLRVHSTLLPEESGLDDIEASARDTSLVAYVRQLLSAAGQRPTWVIVDADDCQIGASRSRSAGARTSMDLALSSTDQTSRTGHHEKAGSDSGAADPLATPDDTLCSFCASGHEAQSESLFEQLAHAVPRGRLLALVQNVHFLPCGPSGTSRRTRGLLKAWAALAGILCVSAFVRDYVATHLAHELQGLASSAEQEAGEATICIPPLRVVHLNAWGCFGHPPFKDFSASAAAQLDGWSRIGSERGLSQDQERSAQNAADSAGLTQPAGLPQGVPTAVPGAQSAVPIIGCLKMTPEKGCSIVHALAQRLGKLCRFLVVSGDPYVADVFRTLSNVKVVAPQKEVDRVLERVCAVLVPSLWLEAWGMVVTDTLLRGIPAITSDTGALPEAGLSHAHVVPVKAISVPVCIQCNTPVWADRQYARQELQPWVEALDALLGSKEEYLHTAAAGRQAALDFVGQQAQELQRLFAWLAGIHRDTSARFDPLLENNYPAA